MPSYTIKNTETNEIKEVIMSFTERDDFLKANPEWVQMLASPRLVSGVGSNLSKTDDGWKETLGRIKAGSGRDNTIKL